MLLDLTGWTIKHPSGTTYKSTDSVKATEALSDCKRTLFFCYSADARLDNCCHICSLYLFD